ncbi:MAG: phage tail tape measure protein [Pseudomonas sp.]|nr:phage tail tape measure protein [Pseudomonas sp.]
MSNRDLNLAMRISADVSRLIGGLAKGEGGLRKFGSAAKGELDALGRFAGSVEGKLAQLGIGVSAVAAGMQSARLDKDLKQLQLTAGATAAEADVLRQSWMEAQIATGQGVDELKSGSDALIAAGLNIDQANGSVRAMAETMAVAKTDARLLGQAMGVAAQNFDIDLSNQQEAALLLDKMVVAGRLGNAELENLPDIFARIGGNAKAANLGLDQTLALVETLSKVEPNAERLATLTDSTLRVFTNDTYRRTAEKATGVRFFDKKGARRDAVEVIGDIKSRYDKLTTDLQRNNFIAKAFGTADQDTIKGLRNLLTGGSMDDFRAKWKSIAEAGGTIKRDLPDAISNAVDQTGRLQGALRKAADDFAQPINEALSGAIKFGLDGKENGGLGLDGKDMLLGGAGLLLGTAAAARYGGKAIQGIAGKLGGTAAGVATGKALEEAAGVTPVFVVNMPDSLGGASGTAEKLADVAGEAFSPKTFSKLKTTLALVGGAPLSALPSMGSGALATAGAGIVAAGAAGYGVGTLASDYLLTDQGPLGSAFGARLADKIGEGVAMLLSPFSEDARQALAVNRAAERDAELAALKARSIGDYVQEARAATGPLAQGAVIPGGALQEATRGLTEQVKQAIGSAKPQPAEVSGRIEVQINSEGRPRVSLLQSRGGVDLTAYTGRTGAGS